MEYTEKKMRKEFKRPTIKKINWTQKKILMQKFRNKKAMGHVDNNSKMTEISPSVSVITLYK